MAKRKSIEGKTFIHKILHRKLKDRATRTTINTGVNSGMIRSSCSTSGTRRVTLVTNLAINERRKYGKVLTTSGPYPLSLVIQLFRNG